jgi:cytoskeletal protein RodZ
LDEEGACERDGEFNEWPSASFRPQFAIERRLRMTKLQTWLMVGVSAAALMIGVLLATGTFTSAQSTTPTPSPAPTSGAFKSNEDPSHEAGESAEREAQEDAGIFPGKHRGEGSKEDASHEASESAEREAEENANQASPTPGG